LHPCIFILNSTLLNFRSFTPHCDLHLIMHADSVPIECETIFIIGPHLSINPKETSFLNGFINTTAPMTINRRTIIINLWPLSLNFIYLPYPVFDFFLLAIQDMPFSPFAHSLCPTPLLTLIYPPLLCLPLSYHTFFLSQ